MKTFIENSMKEFGMSIEELVSCVESGMKANGYSLEEITYELMDVYTVNNVAGTFENGKVSTVTFKNENEEIIRMIYTIENGVNYGTMIDCRNGNILINNWNLDIS